MTPETLAALLRRHRAAAGLTQAELAERSGLSERAVSDIERDLRRRIYPVTARALADALGLDGADRAAFEAAARPGGAATRTHTTPGGSEWLALRRTPLIGRDGDIERLRAALRDPGVVTVTGTGGIGKSRLAAEICGTDEGAAWVSLAAVRDPELMLPTLAAALGLPGDVPIATLASDLEGYRVLVLDTFEGVVDAAADLAGLADQLAHCRVVVTSRVPLQVRGEREIALEPLPPSDAVTLLEARVNDIRPSALAGVGADVVREVADRLGGVPLAIELAAARVRHLSIAGLAEALERPLAALEGGARDVPERHRTMRAALAWSYDLLPSADRALLRAAGVLAGSWDTARVSAVTAGGHSDLLAAVGRLCEHGLVVPLPTAARWRLPDPVRDFAVEQLTATGELGALQRRHAEVVAAAVATRAPRLLGADQAAARAEFREDLGDIRAALETAGAQSDAALCLRIAAASWMFWRLEGAFAEARRWLTVALALPGAGNSPDWPTAAWGLAWVAHQQGDLATATAYAEQLADRTTAIDRRNGLTLLGIAAVSEGATTRAEELLAEALQLAHQHGDRWVVATSMLNLGSSLLHASQVDRATQLLRDAVAGYEECGDLLFVARAREQLAFAAMLRGDALAARKQLEAATDTVVTSDDPWGVADVLAAWAVLAAGREDDRRAAVLHGAASAAWQRIGAHPLGPDHAFAEPYLLSARRRLGDSAWTHAVDAGLALDAAAGLELALVPDALSAAAGSPPGPAGDGAR